MSPCISGYLTWVAGISKLCPPNGYVIQKDQDGVCPAHALHDIQLHEWWDERGDWLKNDRKQFDVCVPFRLKFNNDLSSVLQTQNIPKSPFSFPLS